MKSASHLQVCHHEIRRLLRASGTYTVDSLRSERTKWHPDRIAGRCDPMFKEGLLKQAAEMFHIVQMLIEREQQSLVA